MPKNIVIAEGTTGRNFSGVEKIKTQLQGGGTCNWIPEDEAGDYTNLKTKTITENGEYEAADDNATGYSKVKVNVKLNTKSKRIDANGVYNAANDNAGGYDTVTVNVPTGSNLGTKTIHRDGVYRAAADNLDGYSEVTVSVGGGGGGGTSDLTRGNIIDVNKTVCVSNAVFGR